MAQIQVATAEQLVAAYLVDDPQARVTPGLKNAMGQKLQEQGFVQMRVKVDGSVKRLWIIGDRKGVWDAERARKQWVQMKSKFG
jgi:hypothetical protein